MIKTNSVRNWLNHGHITYEYKEKTLFSPDGMRL